MRITKADIGKKFTTKGWDSYQFIEVLYVGEVAILARDEEGDEVRWNIKNDFWEPYKKPKKIVRMAPALVGEESSGYIFSMSLYSSETEAKNDFPKSFIKWPANDNVWVEVEVEE